MPDKLIGREVAVLAKEKGFNEPTLDHHERGIDGYGWGLFTSGDLLKNEELTPTYTPSNPKGYDIPVGQEGIFGEFSAPTQTCLAKWLREKHNIHASAYPFFREIQPVGYIGNICWFEGGRARRIDIEGLCIIIFGTYEEALEAALLKGLQLIIINEQ